MKKLVFIVDDERGIRRAYGKLLSTCAGYRVHTYECPGDLLNALDEGQDPDLILTDNDMPGMTGIALVRHLRRSGFTKPIIMSSCSYELQRDIELRELLYGFLPKPSPIAEILAMVESALAE